MGATITWTDVMNFIDYRACFVLLFVWFIAYSFYPFYRNRNLGIKGPLPLPLFGNFLQMMFKGLYKVDTACVKKYGPISRIYLGRACDVLIADPELIKQIMIKDFNLYPNRRSVGFDADPPIRSFLTVMKSEHWKHVRSVLTPTFSSGKLKQMVPGIAKTADLLVKNMGEKANKGETFEAKELMGAFTMDVIAKVGFGLEIDSQKNPDDPFVKNAKTAFSGKIRPGLVLALVMPFLVHLFRYFKFDFPVFPMEAMNFFGDIVRRTVDRREHPSYKDGDNERVDLLQLMVNAHISDAELKKAIEDKKPEIKEVSSGHYWHTDGLTTEEVIAQGILIFLAGYDTTASTICFTAYELAWHEELQQRCYEEICEKIPPGTPFTWDVVNELEFLEKCILEALRLYPAAVRIDRCSVKETELAGFTIPAGCNLGFPVYHLHHSPEYWDEPEEFIPDRFIDGQREENTYHYMPFGAGPRQCIAKRLALVEVKIALAKCLQKFKFVVDPDKTEKRPPLLRPFGITYAKNGIHLIVEPRETATE